MRRSSAGGRQSLAPLRVKNDNGSATKQKLRLSSASCSAYGDGRIPPSNSNVYNSGRLSYTGGKRNINRPSISGIPSKVNRRSSMVSGSRGYETLKDPRNISDRGYRDRSIRELVQFLGDHGYPHPISPKILHAPTSKDFYKIFEFLVQFLRRGYKVGKKMEEEIPQMFKQFGYSFTITKSAMITIGSPHSWPALLAALMWLKRNIDYLCTTDVDKTMYPPRQDCMAFGDEIPLDKLADNFFGECYRLFMGGEDNFDELDERFAREYKKNSEGGDCEELIAQNRRLTEEAKVLKEQPDELSHLKDTFLALELDDQRMQQFIKELDLHLQTCHSQRSKVQKELLAEESELETVQAEIPRKQHIFETQEFSQNDVKQINAERQNLHRQIASVEAEHEMVDKDIWTEEMNMGKARDGVEATCEKFNRVAQLLQLIPSTAENAYGIDYELRATPSAAENHKFVSTIKPALNKMKAQCSSKVHELRDRRISEQDILDQLQDMLDDKQECLRQLDAQVKQAESLLSKKQDYKSDVQQLQVQYEELSTELNELRKKYQDADKQIQQDKAEFDKSSRERTVREHRLCDVIKQVAILVVDHKTAIQDMMTKQYVKVQEILNSTKQLTKDVERVALCKTEELKSHQESS